jgi:hypothetical protein
METYREQISASGSVERDEDSQTIEELEFRDGFETTVFDLKHTKTLTRSAPSSYALTYGIEGSAENPTGRTLRTVTWERAEEATDPHQVPFTPGVVPGSSDLLTYTDGLIVFRVAETLTIEGFSPAGGAPWARGDYLDLGAIAGSGIKSAVDCLASGAEVFGDGFFCRRVDVTKEATEWETFSCEFIKYTGNTAENACLNILSSELFGSAEIGAGNQYTVRKTLTLNAEAAADFEEVIDIFEGSA